jgi:hypothetical protein
MVRMNRPIGFFCLANTCSTRERIIDFALLARRIVSGMARPFGFLQWMWLKKPFLGAMAHRATRLPRLTHCGKNSSITGFVRRKGVQSKWIVALLAGMAHRYYAYRYLPD